MTETNTKCGHSKTSVHARGVNKSCKMITFSHSNSTNFNDNFKDNFMQEVNIGRINPIICVIFTFGID